MLIVFTTCPTISDAESLSEKVVAAGLAACVQILPPMTSVYVWEGEVQKESEHLLLIKTLPEAWGKLELLITEEHTYSVPEIVAVTAEQVSAPYLKWMRDVLSIT